MSTEKSVRILEWTAEDPSFPKLFEARGILEIELAKIGLRPRDPAKTPVDAPYTILGFPVERAELPEYRERFDAFLKRHPELAMLEKFPSKE